MTVIIGIMLFIALNCIMLFIALNFLDSILDELRALNKTMEKK